jgi:hypothetical protein
MHSDCAVLLGQIPNGAQVVHQRPQNPLRVAQRLGDIFLCQDLVDDVPVQVSF